MVPSTPRKTPTTPLSPERAFQEVLNENPGHNLLFHEDNKGKIKAVAAMELMHRASRYFLSEANPLNQDICWCNFFNFYRELCVWCGVPEWPSRLPDRRATAEEAVTGKQSQLRECFENIQRRFEARMAEKRTASQLRRSQDRQVARFTEKPQVFTARTKVMIGALGLAAMAVVATRAPEPGGCNCAGCGDPENPPADVLPNSGDDDGQS